METIKPLADRVVVKPNEIIKETNRGIILPESAREKPTKGVVVSVGPGTNRPMTVRQGDTVLYGSYSGTEIKVNGEELLIMRESDINKKMPQLYYTNGESETVTKQDLIKAL